MKSSIYMRPAELGLALRACERLGAVEDAAHKYGPLAANVEARLADVVWRLQVLWVLGPAQMWGEVCPRAQDEHMGGDLEKRVLAVLGEGFFRFSQFLAGCEYLLLEGEEFGVVREETVLRLEQLLVDLGNGCGKGVEVPNANGGASEVSGNG